MVGPSPPLWMNLRSGSDTIDLLTPEEIRKACIQGMQHRVDECIANDGYYGNLSR